MFLTNNKNSNKFWWLLIGVAIFIFFIILILLGYVYFENQYENKIYPGVKINSIDLSGLSREKAKEILEEKNNLINFEGINFVYGNKKTVISPTVVSLEDSWSYQVINFQTKETVDQAFAIGRQDNFWQNLKTKIVTAITSRNLKAQFEINEEEILNRLKESYQKFDVPAQDAQIVATSSKTIHGNESIFFEIKKEQAGKVLNYRQGLEELKNNLSYLVNPTITLSTKISQPNIHKDECLNTDQEAKKIIQKSPFFLQNGEKEWEISAEKIADWLILEKDKSGQVFVSLSNEKIIKFINEEIAPSLEKEPIDARFEIQNGRVIEFQDSQDGLKINRETTIKNIKKDFVKNQATSTALIIEITESKIDIEKTNNLGIEEIIGTGHSDFSGSPANRRHNIKTGSNSINGLIIKPNEEFSLVANLGEIDAESGYLPELVIRDNKTIPEYGGGLCQVATTLFRAALQSGLPIIERRNHSYRVSYYEPAGMDAAVYIPKPDVRFRNDTGHNILIQVRIEGNDLYFDFWGTKDGRKIEITDPTIYNITKPGPTKIIESPDLEPGEKKCTEHAHSGADAYFDYTVTYATSSEAQIERDKIAEEELKEKTNIEYTRFSSHYVPWQAVCLIGQEKNEEDEQGNAKPGETPDENEATTSTPKN